jgi:hypothetical protein
MVKNPSQIRNKAKRQQVYTKYKAQKKKTKKALKEERLKEVEALGDAAPPKQVLSNIPAILIIIFIIQSLYIYCFS